MTSTQLEENLRHWLAQEDYYPSRFTQSFLSSTPLDEANDLLARLAQDADLENPVAWSVFGVGVLASLLFSPLLLSASGDAASAQEANRRKAGVRAALYLARRGDERALHPLVRVWRPSGIIARGQQEQIEHALIHLIATPPTDDACPLPTGPLAELCHRVWHARRLSRDLTAGQTDLLLAVIRHLSGRGGTAEAALRTLQEGAVGKNRALIREIAREACADRL